MMEIKFKAWVGKYKYMVTVTSLHYDEHTGIVRNIYGLNIKYFPRKAIMNVEENAITLRQYTGFKDKNGKDIYDGDVLQTSLTQEYLGLVGWRADYENRQIFEVYWRVGDISNRVIFTEHSKMQYGKLQLSDTFVFETIKVIGNIYENPELLENNNE